MHIDPLVDAHREQLRLARNDHLYWQAHDMLANDFKHALHIGPSESIGTPHDIVGDSQPLVAVVAQMLDCESDHRTLSSLLHVCREAASAGVVEAEGVIEHLARLHATHYAQSMDDAGDLQPDCTP